MRIFLTHGWYQSDYSCRAVQLAISMTQHLEVVSSWRQPGVLWLGLLVALVFI